MKLLVVVDMQHDFVDGALGTKEAVAIVDNVIAKVERYIADGHAVAFTLDTHGEDYMETQEGRNLPVPHCLKGSEGWKLVPDLRAYTDGWKVFEKPTFGSMELARYAAEEEFDRIEVVGLCTDICVISNVMLLKAALPEAEIVVDSACCAGVTPESHNNALEAMKICQVTVI